MKISNKKLPTFFRNKYKPRFHLLSHVCIIKLNKNRMQQKIHLKLAHSFEYSSLKNLELIFFFYKFSIKNSLFELYVLFTVFDLFSFSRIYRFFQSLIRSKAKEKNPIDFTKVRCAIIQSVIVVICKQCMANNR